ncbi:hypothetical protein [Niabella hibiscisoli]|uniref:hypothetical protein n=1 Tax=Niabella hibiscisoli TaxID=1825928 RepID=UPI001F0D7AF3|nr:hypothetical protein [Niabella hibiscisoli]MCH5715871.1 hypothetical protein [Niabella hibiscisoli]
MTDENRSALLNDAQQRGMGEKGLSYLAGFFMLIAFGVGGMLLGGLLGIPVAAAMSGKSIGFITENLQKLTGDSTYLREMQVIQTFSAVFGFLLPTLFTASRLSWSPMKLTGLKGVILGKDLLLTIFITVAALALSGALGYFSFKLPFPVDWRIAFDKMESSYAETAAGIINLDSIPELIISIIVLALVPAICEEVFLEEVCKIIYTAIREDFG